MSDVERNQRTTHVSATALARKSGGCSTSWSTRSIRTAKFSCASWSPMPPTRSTAPLESLTDTRLAPPGEAKVRIVRIKPARTLLKRRFGYRHDQAGAGRNLGTDARSARAPSAKRWKRPSRRTGQISSVNSGSVSTRPSWWPSG